MQEKYIHPSKLLVNTLHRLYDFGMTTTSGGNLSIKDEDGNIWITPAGIDKGTLAPDDIVMVTPDGRIEGKYKPSSELPFHHAVYQKRSDVHAVLHAHSPAIVTFSLIGKIPDSYVFPNIKELFDTVAFAKYEIPGSEMLGEKISAEFANGSNGVIMENHGAVVCGEDINQAFMRFETIDYAARIQINAIGLGKIKKFEKDLPNHEILPLGVEMTSPSPAECKLREDIVQFAKRSYQQRLISCNGTIFSCRISDQDFLITPRAYDPLSLAPEDLVHVHDNECELGKLPSNLWNFIRDIYQKCPWIQSVIFAYPPNLTAFAATASVMDSRTIPESYIMLRDISMVSQIDFAGDSNSVISRIKKSNPVVLLESCGVLTVGQTLLEAFDRLEVGEFTANCILMAQRIGKLNPINQKQVDDLIHAFKLPTE